MICFPRQPELPCRLPLFKIIISAIYMKRSSERFITYLLLAFLSATAWSLIRDAVDFSCVSTAENRIEPASCQAQIPLSTRPGNERQPKAAPSSGQARNPKGLKNMRARRAEVLPQDPKKGPTPAFPSVLPPLPHGHIIEVGIELEQPIAR